SSGNVKFGAMSTNTMHNRQVMANVVGYYASSMGISTNVGISNHTSKPSSEALAFKRGESIYVNARGGGVTPLLSDYRNLNSTLVHERTHEERGEGFEDKDADPAFESYRHADVYLKQMQDPTFAETTEGYRKGMVGSALG